ncbi:hypothetical protein GCM10009742_14170 [Kribbella karoonensis]|uniref:Uncharacterized protein n=2 Tax=Kribbellaceae TaxID=2726069 RepID=A0ABN2D8H0_9ACTN
MIISTALSMPGIMRHQVKARHIGLNDVINLRHHKRQWTSLRRHVLKVRSHRTLISKVTTDNWST